MMNSASTGKKEKKQCSGLVGLMDPNPVPPLFHAKLRKIFHNLIKKEQI